MQVDKVWEDKAEKQKELWRIRAEERAQRHGRNGEKQWKEIKGEDLKQQTVCHLTVAQFTAFWPIMLYSTISDGTVVSCDLISQLISLRNVNTKAKAEPLAASSAHPPLLVHNWLLWKEAREGKHPAIILTPASRNWNPLTISAWMIEVVLETQNVHNLSRLLCVPHGGAGLHYDLGVMLDFCPHAQAEKRRLIVCPVSQHYFTPTKKKGVFPPSKTHLIRKTQRFDSLKARLHWINRKIRTVYWKNTKTTRRTFYILIYHFHPLWWGMKWEPSLMSEKEIQFGGSF